MAPDNVTAGTVEVATDKVTYSGDADRDLQLVRVVNMTGSEGSKTVVENMPASLGQKAKTASFPVVLSSDHDVLSVAIPDSVEVNVAVSALPAGASTEATLAAASAKLPASLGQKAMAASFPVVLASDQGAIPVQEIGIVMVQGAAEEDQAHTANPLVIGGKAKAAAPADVSADGDAVNGWFLRNGAQAVNLTAAGALIPGNATDGLLVNLGGNNDVTVAALPLPTGASTLAQQQTQTTHLSDIVDALGTDLTTQLVIASPITTLGTATYLEGTSKGTTIGAVRRDADTTLVGTTNEIGPLQMDANGRLKVEAFSGETLPVSLASTTVTGTVAVTQSGTWDEVGINDSGNSITVDGTVAVTGVATETTLNSALTALAIMDDWDETDRAKVNTIAGQVGVQGGAGAVTALTQRVVLATDTTNPNTSGDTAHDAGDSGNPVKMGWKAANAFPTAVANADRANGISDLFGRQLVSHIDPAMQIYKIYNDTSSRAAASAVSVWDPTSGTRIAITSLIISTYGTTAGRIFLFFADDADLTYSAGTDQALFVGSFAPSATAKPGLTIAYSVPIVCTTANRRLHYQNDAAISVDITIYGYEF